MKTIKMMLVAGFLILSFVSTANAGKPGPVIAVDCGYFDVVDLGNYIFTHDDTDGDTHACWAELSDLCYAIDLANTLGSLGDKDRDTMVSKTIGADIKLEQGKESEADAKLHLIDTKLDSLLDARKPKISKKDYDAIDNELVDAQICVDIVFPHTD